MKKGKFREDLYQRLNVIPLQLPNLCDRAENIPELVQYFLFGVTGVAGLTLALCRRVRAAFWAGVGITCLIVMNRAELETAKQKGVVFSLTEGAMQQWQMISHTVTFSYPMTSLALFTNHLCVPIPQVLFSPSD